MSSKFISKEQVYEQMHWLDSEAGDNFEGAYREILQNLSEDIKIPCQVVSSTETPYGDINLVVLVKDKEFSQSLKHFDSDYIDDSIFSLVNRILQKTAPHYRLVFDPNARQEIIWGVFSEQEIEQFKSLEGLEIEFYSEEEIPQ